MEYFLDERYGFNFYIFVANITEIWSMVFALIFRKVHDIFKVDADFLS